MPDSPPYRRWTTRATVRVLVLAAADQVLLLHDSDAPVGARWWITPGGGIDAGETELEAVVRELHEETGLRVDPLEVLGPIARRRVLHGYSDVIVDQHDTFHAVRVPAPFEVSTAGHTEDELRTLLGHRWWHLCGLAAHDQVLWPHLLPDLIELVDEPQRWPVQLADVEESSVPVTAQDRARRA